MPNPGLLMISRLIASFVFLTVSIAALPSIALEVIVGGTGVKNTVGEEKWLTFQRNAEKAANGSISMRMLIYGELGPEENLVNGIRRGRVHVANWSGLATTTVVPEMAMLYTPYMFESYAEADFVMDEFLFDAYAKLLAERDIEFLRWDEIGFNQIYGKIPILTPVESEGVRFRTSASESARLFAEAIGADAIPLGFTDIVTGLQTGLVDSGESSIIMYAPTGIAGEAGHLTLTNHSFATSIIVMRKSWADRLPDDQQRILRSSYIDVDVGRQWTRGEWKGFLDNADQWKFTTHDLSAEQRALWKSATAPVARQLIDSIGGRSQDIWDIVQDGKRAFAAQQ